MPRIPPKKQAKKGPRRLSVFRPKSVRAFGCFPLVRLKSLLRQSVQTDQLPPSHTDREPNNGIDRADDEPVAPPFGCWNASDLQGFSAFLPFMPWEKPRQRTKNRPRGSLPPRPFHSRRPPSFLDIPFSRYAPATAPAAPAATPSIIPGPSSAGADVMAISATAAAATIFRTLRSPLAAQCRACSSSPRLFEIHIS